MQSLNGQHFNCTERRSRLYPTKRMSLGGRRTRPLFPSPSLHVHPIPVFILRQSHFYRASYAHAHSYGCALNYGLSSRARTTEDGSQIDHAEPAPLSRRTFSFLSAYLFFFLSFIHSLPLMRKERYTSRTAGPRVSSGNARDANEVDSSRPAAGTDSSDSFSLMKESSVRLCN